MYPQQYQDLLDFLDQNPQFREDLRLRLLTQELIALPEQFARLVNVVTELVNHFNHFKELTDRRLSTLETDVATLKDDVATLKDNVATLMGNDLERRARENILNIAKDELDLTRGNIVLARTRDTAQTFLYAIERAEANGTITEEEADHVLVADIIIRARRSSDRQYVHAVFEVSRTIGASDIQRARDRADTVAKATGTETIAAVVGTIIQPQQALTATALDVHTLMPAMFRTELPESSADDC